MNAEPSATGDARRKYQERDYPLQDLTDSIIKAAIAVHRELGPGFVEGIYENSLVCELEAPGHKVQRQQSHRVYYHKRLVGAICVGDIDRAGIYTGLIRDGVDVGPFQDHLLSGNFGLISLPKAYRKHLVQGEGIEV